MPLLFGPSPVHRLERLSEHLGGGVEIWAKREDCNSGLASGGNKTRKLEYLAADALAQGGDTLVSIGGVQSNHTRQVAAVAAKLGLEWSWCRSTGSTGPMPSTTRSATSCCRGSWAPTCDSARPGFDIGIRPSWEEALASVEERGGKPYAIPAGASDHPLGGLGFANWARGAEQEEELGVFFDTIVVMFGDRLHAGRHDRGLRGAGRAAQVLGIDGSATVEQTRDQIARIALQTAEAIGLGRTCATMRSCCSTSGTPARTGSRTRRPSRRSGSARVSRACSPTRCTRESRWPRSSTSSATDASSPARSVLYAHLGGQPALNAYAGGLLRPRMDAPRTAGHAGSPELQRPRSTPRLARRRADIVASKQEAGSQTRRDLMSVIRPGGQRHEGEEEDQRRARHEAARAPDTAHDGFTRLHVAGLRMRPTSRCSRWGWPPASCLARR